MTGHLRAVPPLPAVERPVRLWDRQEHDTPKSWEAFAAYRDQGPGRTYQRVAAELQKNYALIRRWSIQHDWKARCRAYDTAEDEAVQARLQTSRWRVAERHAALARRGQRILLDAMAALDPTLMTAQDIVAWARVMTGIEREVYFPKEGPDVAVTNQIAQILIDPILVPPPTQQPRTVVDADVRPAEEA